MELLLYKNYLLYLNQNSSKITDVIKKAPKSIIILLVALSIAVLFALLTIILEPLRRYYFAALIIEIVVSIINFTYTQRYEINNSLTNLYDYKEYCNNLYTWLSGVLTNSKKENIEDIKNRIDNHIKKHEQHQQKVFDVLFRFVQVLIIPVILTILAVIMEKEVDINMIFTYGIFAVLIPSFLVVTLFGFISFISILKKSEYAKIKSFSNDLQGILDTQFNNGIMAKKERKK
ncbi:MAG: hypothetical protein IKL10_10845 [Clostridia bacterium]|nr:hypothetical protein [Clostridia bacterium]